MSGRMKRTIQLLNCDCMEYMATVPDKYFDLAIVDPPYGINIETWDYIPNDSYFDELFRISEKQIIFGGNYFSLPHNEGWICWDKTFNDDIKEGKLTRGGCPREYMSDFELLWTSFLKKSKMLRFTQIGNLIGFNQKIKVDYTHHSKIHPTQKHPLLYKWLLKNYATPDMKIFDSHGGSFSSAIACYDFGTAEYVGCELDKEYYDKAVERFEQHKAQTDLFRSDNETL